MQADQRAGVDSITMGSTFYYLRKTKILKMTDLSLYTKISTLPDYLKSEVVDFIDFLHSKRKNEKIKSKKGRVFGYAKGKIILKPGFDDPIDDFKEYT
jgi:hypothetical protein